MSGGPSHIDLFDYKPKLKEHHGEELPGSIRMGQRITGMTVGPEVVPVRRADVQVRPARPERRRGSASCLPHIGDDRRRHHDRQVAEHRGDQSRPGDHLHPDRPASSPGRPSLGAWLSYGLGSENQNLPAFVVLISQGSGNKTDQPIFSRLWGSGFLPTEHQGVRFRAGDDPVLYLSNPPGIDADGPPPDARRRRPAERAGRRSRSATRRSTPGSPSTRWPTGCRPRSPT